MKTWKLLFLVGLHFILGHAFRLYPILATGHAYLLLVIGVFWAFRAKTTHILYVAAYIVGSEVLWRMTSARIFWESGKYMIVLILGIRLITRGWTRPFLPLMFFALLLPSTLFLPFKLYSADQKIVQDVSFNLSGPFCLTIAVLAFSKIKITKQQLLNIFIKQALPVVSILTISGDGTKTAEDLYFTESSFATSGGFGPNQVSAILGLAAFCLGFCLMAYRWKMVPKVILFLLAMALATQSALTFSRGGVYAASVAAVAAAICLMKNKKNWYRIVLIFGALLLIANFVVWPRLIKFTGGAIEKRFKETSMTNREGIFMDDMRLFAENVWLGVGPGQAKKVRSFDQGAASHTEFSRLLSEHGIFGVLALLSLLIMAFSLIKRGRNSFHRAVALSGVLWSFAYMLVNGMRLAAPCLMFGLSAAQFFDNLPSLSVILANMKKKQEGPEPVPGQP